MPYDDGTPYNEADTRAKLIDPSLKAAGWGESQIEREHYFVKNRQITDGRIYLTGDRSGRRKPKKVDYLLRYHGQMVAVVEAKEEADPGDSGLGQARGSAAHPAHLGDRNRENIHRVPDRLEASPVWLAQEAHSFP